MNKIKTICICLLIPVLVFVGFIFLRMKKQEEFKQKAVLAKEMRKVLGYLMFDLSEARESTILDAPADGLWHDRVAFDRTGQGALEYTIKDGHLFRTNKGNALFIADNISSLRIRHERSTPDILEVQIEAHKNVSLKTYLRMRIHE